MYKIAVGRHGDRARTTIKRCGKKLLTLPTMLLGRQWYCQLIMVTYRRLLTKQAKFAKYSYEQCSTIRSGLVGHPTHKYSPPQGMSFFLFPKLLFFPWCPIRNSCTILDTLLMKDFLERCPLCWNEWKINFPIFIFWVVVDFVIKIIRIFWFFWPKRCAMFWNDECRTEFQFFAFFSLRDMADFILKIPIDLGT